jgi:hypothetical protein
MEWAREAVRGIRYFRTLLRSFRNKLLDSFQSFPGDMKRGNKNVFQCSKKNEFWFPQNAKAGCCEKECVEVVEVVEVVAARVLECVR